MLLLGVIRISGSGGEDGCSRRGRDGIFFLEETIDRGNHVLQVLNSASALNVLVEAERENVLNFNRHGRELLRQNSRAAGGVERVDRVRHCSCMPWVTSEKYIDDHDTKRPNIIGSGGIETNTLLVGDAFRRGVASGTAAEFSGPYSRRK